MDESKEREIELNKKSNIDLQEFCDMNQLYLMLDNWAKCSGMSAVIADTEGNLTSENYGLTEFCRCVQSCEKGQKICHAAWNADYEGLYTCPVGFCDFSVPIVLPNGQVLGKVLAGQSLSVQQNEEEILNKTTELGLEREMMKDVISRIHRKTQTEMQGAYKLLEEMLSVFIDKNY